MCFGFSSCLGVERLRRLACDQTKVLQLPAILYVTYVNVRDNQQPLMRNCGLKMAVDLFCKVVHRILLVHATEAQLTC